jgi:hypothetical protein
MLSGGQGSVRLNSGVKLFLREKSARQGLKILSPVPFSGLPEKWQPGVYNPWPGRRGGG